MTRRLAALTAQALSRRCQALLAAILSLVLSTAAMAQTFDKLTACDDMAALRHAVDADPSHCGQARGRIARAIGTRVRATTCFFAPSAQSLAGFECAQAPGVPQIICFRDVSSAAVQRVRSNYTNGYDQIIARYFSAAHACEYSSGKVSPAPINMINFTPLGWVAKAELAYGAETGRDGTSDGAVIHGFGSTDPDANLPPAIEFVLVYGNRCRSSDCYSYRPHEDDGEEVERTNDLVLIRDAADDMLQNINRQMLRAGLPIRYYASSFRIDPVAPAAIQTLEQAAAWRRTMADLPARQSATIRHVLAALEAELRDDGFRRPSANEIGDSRKLLDQLTQGNLVRQPYALRASLGKFEFNLLVKDRGSGCFRNGLVMVFYGAQGNAITLLLGGVGDCKYRASSQLSRLSTMVSLSGY